MPTSNLISDNAANLFDLLSIESHAGILDYQAHKSSVPLWLLIRPYFLRLLLSELLYKESPLISLQAPKTPIIKALNCIVLAKIRTLTYPSDKPVDVLIRSTGAGLQIRDGLLFNRLCDHFVGEKQSTTEVLEDFFDWRWPTKRHFDRVIYNTPLRTLDLMRSKLTSKQVNYSVVAALCDFLGERCKSLLNWDIDQHQKKWLMALTVQAASSAPIWYSRYLELLQRKKVKLLIVEEASYGGWLACLIKAAKDLGIPTAEYQHGLISKGHYAYNYAPNLLTQKKLIDCLPEYFLTYGSWWGTQINAPVRQIVVGNPHRDFYKNAACTDKAVPSDILILGDGRETAKYLHLAAALVLHIKNSDRIVFRPHPEERHKFKNSTEKKTDSGVYIDTNADIYDSLRQAHTIISEVSTGLFEAIGFVNRILVWETAKSKFGIPNHPFTGFASVEQAAHLINDDGIFSSHVALSETIWASNWKSRYNSFLQEAANL